ncbi:MAG TPA: KamA family radical SAM protein [Candidatus Wallbacteria bacterium]|nr:KamA family radical SAM protein [Candidatus Wallbacteria bacterium]
MKQFLKMTKKELIDYLWEENPDIKRLLKFSKISYEARNNFFAYLNFYERNYFNVQSEHYNEDIPIVERNNAKECIRVLKNIIRTENDKISGQSAFELLFSLACDKKEAAAVVSEGFLCEMIFLLKGVKAKSEGYLCYTSPEEYEDGRKGAIKRSGMLDSYSRLMFDRFKNFKTGMDKELISGREKMKNKILKYFKAEESDWQDYKWHLKNVITDLETLLKLVKLSAEEIEGLKLAARYGIAFQITPYYLSLFNEKGRTPQDASIRAQVLHSVNYCENVAKSRKAGADMDYMGEKSTSPVDLITRRYAQIVILKPYDSCPQICTYCQRNWEITDLKSASVTGEKLKKAVKWIADNPNVVEVLLTGGDPLTLTNGFLDEVLGELSRIKHLMRIRIGTRTLVTMPQRIDEGLIEILKKYHKWGRREICIMTHFQHFSEITPEACAACEKIKSAGMNIYNQQVFTFFNSKKFETCLLRKTLKIIGVDPYYTFNTKGKQETADFRVPIARLEQERKEEARLLPGIVRTDEPVFNVPKIGKSHLRAWQDHEPIMITADGKRIYRFFPWESRFAVSDAYVYADVSIYDYLKRLESEGENVDDYKTIWYYF